MKSSLLLQQKKVRPLPLIPTPLTALGVIKPFTLPLKKRVVT
jgi:hypothetical protein